MTDASVDALLPIAFGTRCTVDGGFLLLLSQRSAADPRLRMVSIALSVNRMRRSTSSFLAVPPSPQPRPAAVPACHADTQQGTLGTSEEQGVAPTSTLTVTPTDEWVVFT
jgi:hypothetical protein